jgi:hypothetical protein
MSFFMQVLLLMRNLSMNLTSPEFEPHVYFLFLCKLFVEVLLMMRLHNIACILLVCCRGGCCQHIAAQTNLDQAALITCITYVPCNLLFPCLLNLYFLI